MKNSILLLISVLFFCCKGDPDPMEKPETAEKEIAVDFANDFDPETVSLSSEEANSLAKMGLTCLETKFPYHLNMVLTSEESLKLPGEIHGAFLGCYSWQSSAQTLWMLANLAKQFPEIQQIEAVMDTLQSRLSAENIQKEIAFFKNNTNTFHENPYAWAWLLKLSAEIHEWRVPRAQELEKNLLPLSNLTEEKIKKYMGQLTFPVRTGNEENTAFILNLAYDYAESVEDLELLDYLKKTASDFYLSDDAAPMEWEPSGKDFLSPCLEEVGLMSNVLSEAAFGLWIGEYMPQLENSDYNLKTIEFSEKNPQPWFQALNYNRARIFYSLANKFPSYEHLRKVGDAHISGQSFKIFDGKTDSDLRVTALYALNERKSE